MTTPTKTNRITVADLPDQISQPHPRPFLYCPHCGSEYSAHRGDYFLAEPRTVLQCSNGHRRANLLLVQRVSHLVEVAA